MNVRRSLGGAALSAATFVGLVSLAHCERTPAEVPPPPMPAASADDSEADASADRAQREARPPLTATFVDLRPAGTPVTRRACEKLLVAIVRGNGSVGGESLARGDAVVFSAGSEIVVKGDGLGVVAAIAMSPCPKAPVAAPAPRVVRADAAPPLDFAGGRMRAHLDIHEPLDGVAYAGRLSGDAGVPEHVHETSWEILCAVDAHGTLTIAGEKKRIEPRTVTIVAPNTKHAWAPDPGSTLEAFQFYAPPGPEERFRALAASARDASTGTR